VLNLIQFPPMEDDAILPVVFNSRESELDLYNGAQLRSLEKMFMNHLARYFSGIGHPNHHIYNDLISLDHRDAARKDTAFRARQFLSLISGSGFLAVSPPPLEVSHSMSLPLSSTGFILCYTDKVGSASSCRTPKANGGNHRLESESTVTQDVFTSC
jgi:hypothetical protein